MSLLTPLNVNCHASDGRKVSLSLCKKNIKEKYFKKIFSLLFHLPPPPHIILLVKLLHQVTTHSVLLNNM